MKQIQLNVPDMQSEHCQLRVKKAIDELLISVNPAIKPGMVEIATDQFETIKRVQQAIEKAGYTVSVSQISEPDAATGEAYQFKTNINCSGCVATVKPHLDNIAGVGSWEVDTTKPQKVLTVHSAGISADEIVSTVEKAGFKIEPLTTNTL